MKENNAQSVWTYGFSIGLKEIVQRINTIIWISTAIWSNTTIVQILHFFLCRSYTSFWDDSHDHTNFIWVDCSCFLEVYIFFLNNKLLSGIKVRFLNSWNKFLYKGFVVAQHGIYFGWEVSIWVVWFLSLEFVWFFVFSCYLFFSNFLLKGVETIYFIYFTWPNEKRRMELETIAFPFS